MLGKVFEIGYTLRKKMPILIRNPDYSEKEWADIFYMNNHLFNLTMRRYGDDVRLSTLLIYSHCNLKSQHDSSNLICKAFHLRSQIKNTHKKFIPVMNLYSHTLSGCVSEKWDSSYMSNKTL